MGQKYTHLSAEERGMIEIEIGNGASLRSVARRLVDDSKFVAVSQDSVGGLSPFTLPSQGYITRAL